MDVLLIAGLWLRHSIWNDVATELERLGHRTSAVALPGVDDGLTTATLTDQVDAVVAEIDRSKKPMVVGHSAACTLAWMAADRRPDTVGPVVLIGGFPAADGDAYADFFETIDGVMAFPGWGPFEGADSADLDEEARNKIASGAVAVPEGVSKGIVSLTDKPPLRCANRCDLSRVHRRPSQGLDRRGRCPRTRRSQVAVLRRH